MNITVSIEFIIEIRVIIFYDIITVSNWSLFCGLHFIQVTFQLVKYLLVGNFF